MKKLNEMSTKELLVAYYKTIYRESRKRGNNKLTAIRDAASASIWLMRLSVYAHFKNIEG
jgi:hypothetical protein